MRLLRIFFIGILFCLIATQAAASDSSSFIVKHIRIQGLQRISKGTVLSYLPINVGDRMWPSDSEAIIESLYKTSFFQDIKVARQGNTLIIRVIERPTIGSIEITGNRSIPTDKLKDSLKDSGLAEGRVFDRSTLTSVKRALEAQYFDLGRYTAKVTTTVTPQPRNRVNISIHVAEGKVAKIKQIKIIGNKTFKEKELLKQFRLSTPKLLSFLTQNDLYTKDKLRADLERLKSYYMDRGFLKFKIDSSQVAVTPSRKNVYITIHVTEGPKYYFSGFKLAGKLILPREELRKLITIKDGDVFSRKAVIAADQAIGNKLGDLGYAFARVVPQPKVDDKKRMVFVTFFVDPGHRVYVRRISFTGNSKTSDEALRQVIRQMEGGTFSLSNIKESERQLKLSGYLKDVGVKTPLVPGTNDQVDVNFDVKETPSASVFVSLGYGSDGVEYGAGLSQTNFLGTGKYLNINVNHSEYERDAVISYNNPYYTPNGVQRGFSLYAHGFRPEEIDLSDYETDRYGGNMSFAIPVGKKDDFINLSLGAEREHIKAGSDAATEVTDFINEHGRSFNEAIVAGGWSHNGYDQAIFPTRGLNQSVGVDLSLPLDSDSLTFYTIDYNAHYYRPMSPLFILSLRGEAGYGGGIGNTKGLPFYENFFAGGIDSVRGYDTDSLGPRDSQGNPFGGNVLLDGSIGVVLVPLSTGSLRTTVFFDGGNTFQDKLDLGDLRYSVGIDEEWRSPLGPIEFSLAEAINADSDDDKEPFQFQIGTSF